MDSGITTPERPPPDELLPENILLPGELPELPPLPPMSPPPLMLSAKVLPSVPLPSSPDRAIVQQEVTSSKYSPSHEESDEEAETLVIRPKVFGKDQAKKRLLAFSLSKQTTSSPAVALKKLKKTPKDKNSQLTKMSATDQFRATVDAIEEEKKKMAIMTVPSLLDRQMRARDATPGKDAEKKRRSRSRSRSPIRGRRSRSSSGGRNKHPRSGSKVRSRSRSASRSRNRRSTSRRRSRSRSGKRDYSSSKSRKSDKPNKEQEELPGDWKSYKEGGWSINNRLRLRNEDRYGKARLKGDIQPVFNYLKFPRRPMQAVSVIPVIKTAPKTYPQKIIRFTETKPMIMWAQSPIYGSDCFYMPRSMFLANADKSIIKIFQAISDERETKYEEGTIFSGWFPKDEFLKPSEVSVKEPPPDEPPVVEIGGMRERKLSGLVEEYASDDDASPTMPGAAKVLVAVKGNSLKVKSKWDSDYEDSGSDAEETRQPEIEEEPSKFRSPSLERMEEDQSSPKKIEEEESVPSVWEKKNSDEPEQLVNEYEEFLKLVETDTVEQNESLESELRSLPKEVAEGQAKNNDWDRDSSSNEGDHEIQRESVQSVIERVEEVGPKKSTSTRETGKLSKKTKRNLSGSYASSTSTASSSSASSKKKSAKKKKKKRRDSSSSSSSDGSSSEMDNKKNSKRKGKSKKKNKKQKKISQKALLRELDLEKQAIIDKIAQLNSLIQNKPKKAVMRDLKELEKKLKKASKLQGLKVGKKGKTKKKEKRKKKRASSSESDSSEDASRAKKKKKKKVAKKKESDSDSSSSSTTSSSSSSNDEKSKPKKVKEKKKKDKLKSTRLEESVKKSTKKEKTDSIEANVEKKSGKKRSSNVDESLSLESKRPKLDDALESVWEKEVRQHSDWEDQLAIHPRWDRTERNQDWEVNSEAEAQPHETKWEGSSPCEEESAKNQQEPDLEKEKYSPEKESPLQTREDTPTNVRAFQIVSEETSTAFAPSANLSPSPKKLKPISEPPAESGGLDLYSPGACDSDVSESDSRSAHVHSHESSHDSRTLFKEYQSSETQESMSKDAPKSFFQTNTSRDSFLSTNRDRSSSLTKELLPPEEEANQFIPNTNTQAPDPSDVYDPLNVDSDMSMEDEKSNPCDLPVDSSHIPIGIEDIPLPSLPTIADILLPGEVRKPEEVTAGKRWDAPPMPPTKESPAPIREFALVEVKPLMKNKVADESLTLPAEPVGSSKPMNYEQTRSPPPLPPALETPSKPLSPVCNLLPIKKPVCSPIQSTRIMTLQPKFQLKVASVFENDTDEDEPPTKPNLSTDDSEQAEKSLAASEESRPMIEGHSNASKEGSPDRQSYKSHENFREERVEFKEKRDSKVDRKDDRGRGYERDRRERDRRDDRDIRDRRSDDRNWRDDRDGRMRDQRSRVSPIRRDPRWPQKRPYRRSPSPKRRLRSPSPRRRRRSPSPRHRRSRSRSRTRSPIKKRLRSRSRSPLNRRSHSPRSLSPPMKRRDDSPRRRRSPTPPPQHSDIVSHIPVIGQSSTISLGPPLPNDGEMSYIEQHPDLQRLSLDQRIELELGVKLRESPPPLPPPAEPPPPAYPYNGNNNQVFYQNQNLHNAWGPPPPIQHFPPPQGAVLQVGNIMEVVPSLHPPPPPPPPPPSHHPHQQIVQVGNVLQVVPSTRATAVVPPTLVATEPTPPPNVDVLQNPLIKAIQAEREKRRKEKEARKLEREMRRRSRQAKREAKMMSVAERLKKSVRNEGLMLGQDLEDEELLLEAMEPPSPPGPMVVVDYQTLPPAGKGILVSSGFNRLKDSSVKKGVKFADGLLPGEASTSGGEEKTPPPKPKLPKEKRFKKKMKKKVKVQIIRQVIQSAEEDEEEDDLPPPPPPPGDPPPILYATFPYGGQVQYPVYKTSVTTTTVTTVQYPPTSYQ